MTAIKRTTLAVLVASLAALASVIVVCPAASATTKEELLAFVREARTYAKAHTKTEALRAFNDPKGGFVRDELYIFAFDFHGICLAHGATPVLVGKDMLNMTDRAGNKVIALLTKAAEKGEGSVEYLWQNPATKSYDKKLSHVIKMDAEWFLGAGIYLGPADPASLKR